MNRHIGTFDGDGREYLREDERHRRALPRRELSQLLMWAHDAQHQRGFLIGVNGDGRIFDDGLVARLPLDAVSYCHHRPSAERVRHLPQHTLYFTKSRAWAYEREWRIVTSVLFGPNGEAPEVAPDKFSFQLTTKDVRTVIIGHRAAAIFPDLYNILREPEYEHVSMKLALPHIERFEIQLKNWPRSKWGNTAPPELLAYAAHEVAPVDN